MSGDVGEVRGGGGGDVEREGEFFGEGFDEPLIGVFDGLGQGGEIGNDGAGAGGFDIG